MPTHMFDPTRLTPSPREFLRPIPTPPVVKVSHSKKNLWVAGLLSFLMPGAGFFYLGRWKRGIAWLAGTLAFGLVIGRLVPDLPNSVYSVLPVLVEVDTVRVGRALRDGTQVPDPPEARRWAIVVAFFVSIVYVLILVSTFVALFAAFDTITKSVPTAQSEPLGSVTFAKDLDGGKLIGLSDTFPSGTPFFFGAHLRHYFYVGEEITVEIAKVSGVDRSIILTKSIPMSTAGVVFNGTATLGASGTGIYAIKVTSKQGTEAEGTVTITGP